MTKNAPALLLTLAVALLGAGGRTRVVPEPWQVGYWYWRAAAGGAGPLPAAVTPDVVYVQVGTLSAAGLETARWPSAVPPARGYFATWRADEARVPDAGLLPALARAQARLVAEAAAAGQRVDGLQLDVDCPTGSLPAYADFLGRLRRALDGRALLSVTALLDWFRPGTSVRRLAASVDEYVPQFYDARPEGPGRAIGEAIDAERWRPVFEGLGTRYRIGVSAFGRIQRVRADGRGERRDGFRDLRLLDLWAGGLRPAPAATSPSAETVLSWEVERPPLSALEPGDRVEAVVPTAASVRAAHEAARRFGPRCAGVVYFRWPARDETLALGPDEVAAALSAAPAPGAPRLDAHNGGCAPRACADLTLRIGDRFAARPARLVLSASEDVEYVMAAQPAIGLRQTGARTLALTLPAYVGEREVLLGRAFSRRAGRYAIAGEER